jgi:hypothetical protein
MQDRVVTQVITPALVSEGAGVRLRRSFPGRSLDHLDPFLLLDDFSSDRPKDYLAGFPMHPHRGIETVTYLLDGEVHHQDSIGHAGVVGPGDCQWMTAGRGILHEEMPRPVDGRIAGFQLWVNLPARLKMTAPRYQEVPAYRIPQLLLDDGVQVRLVAGRVGQVEGPVREIAAEPTYLDVTIPAGVRFQHPVEQSHNALIYLYAGVAHVSEQQLEAPRLAVLGEGDRVIIHATDAAAHLLLVAGRPWGEPVARYGPFVMNTREEIQHTLLELRQGTFIR